MLQNNFKVIPNEVLICNAHTLNPLMREQTALGMNLSNAVSFYNCEIIIHFYIFNQ